MCSACHADLPWLRQPLCPLCALPSPGGETCGTCLKHPPAFEHTHAALTYGLPLDRLIPRLKYRAQLSIVPALGRCLSEAVAIQPRPDRLIQMPLHRIREREFNHATELARVVARQLDLPLDLPLDTARCHRIRDTPPQMGLKHDARRRNGRGAFACSGAVAGIHIALIDDVMPTGTRFL